MKLDDIKKTPDGQYISGEFAKAFGEIFDEYPEKQRMAMFRDDQGIVEYGPLGFSGLRRGIIPDKKWTENGRTFYGFSNQKSPMGFSPGVESDFWIAFGALVDAAHEGLFEKRRVKLTIDTNTGYSRVSSTGAPAQPPTKSHGAVYVITDVPKYVTDQQVRNLFDVTMTHYYESIRLYTIPFDQIQGLGYFSMPTIREMVDHFAILSKTTTTYAVDWLAIELEMGMSTIWGYYTDGGEKKAVKLAANKVIGTWMRRNEYESAMKKRKK